MWSIGIEKWFNGRTNKRNTREGRAIQVGTDKPKAIRPKFKITEKKVLKAAEEEINKSDIGQVAKFFTSEAYARAKNMLKTKHGRASELANAHIQSIMGLPVITATNPSRICEFYEKLVTNI